MMLKQYRGENIFFLYIFFFVDVMMGSKGVDVVYKGVETAALPLLCV